VSPDISQRLGLINNMTTGRLTIIAPAEYKPQATSIFEEKSLSPIDMVLILNK